MSRVMNCGCRVWRYADRLLGTRRCAPSLAPWIFLVEHVEMSVEGNIVRLSLESLATRH